MTTSPPNARDFTTQVWLVLASLRTTSVLVILLALTAGLASVIPQGSDALELARLEHSEDIRRLAVWGLTNIFDSAWLKALLVLLGANVVAVAFQSARRPALGGAVAAPQSAPHLVELDATRPERAVESLRESFRIALGTSPLAEDVNGAKVTLVFDTSPRASFAPLLAHLGVVLLVVGAGLTAGPPPPGSALVRAVLEVTDSRTRTVGVFDMVERETRKFFQFKPDFSITGYSPSRDGLGPAIRMQKVFTEERRIDDFWIYRDAPPGFDQRHRSDIVAIVARSIGISPAPGAGLASSPAAILLASGLALLLIGLLTSRRPEGRLWIEADGDRVRIVAVPSRLGDTAFARTFGRWKLIATDALGA